MVVSSEVSYHGYSVSQFFGFVTNQPQEVLPTDPSRFPDLGTLERGLSDVLLSERARLAQCAKVSGGQVAVVSRETSDYSSTFASESVDCRLPDGQELTVFCKYSHGHRHAEPSPRRGLLFEADVYDYVLRPLALPQVRCYGNYREPFSGETWLVLEYLPDALWASHSFSLDAMSDSAKWIAGFHAFNRDRIHESALAFLPRYAANDYRFWSQRTWTLCEAAGLTPDWLRPRCQHYEQVCVPLLAAQAPTVIHGEFTPRNSLWHAGEIKPVDWETTAFGVGETDLAILTYDWDDDTIAACEHVYQQTRWPDGSPHFFREVLRAARLYAAFHWIYGGSEEIHPKDIESHLGELRKVSDREGWT